MEQVVKVQTAIRWDRSLNDLTIRTLYFLPFMIVIICPETPGHGGIVGALLFGFYVIMLTF